VVVLEDLEIVEQLKQGSEECFIQIVDKFKKKVISLCYTYTSDYQEAEDLSQEVFISFNNSIDKFRGDCSISTYIYRIAVSRCLDYKRRKNLKGFFDRSV
jgi:RNA polymerase sigma-70 factor (ECF subfamily)